MKRRTPLAALSLAVALGAPSGGVAAEALTAPAPQPLGPRDERPIAAVGVDIAASAGRLPDDSAAAHGFATTPAGVAAVRTWPIVTRPWEASATRHRPLYFEEASAERYGYTRSACLQPALSTAHFFATIPALPYLMAADCPCDCVYTLGHYRSGSCVPNRRHGWPLSVPGAAAEAATIVGLIALLP